MESLDIVLEKYHKTLTWEEKVKYAEGKKIPSTRISLERCHLLI